MRILITAGPTREYLDSIRFLSNPSSGRMGYAIARAAARRGHEVVLISGPVPIRSPAGVRTIAVTSAAQMLAAARREFARCDAAVFAAAVCDYRPVTRHARKRPKSTHRWSLELAPTPDIAAALGRGKGKRVTVCFALEDHDARAHAEGKLHRKNADAVLLNGPENVGSTTARFEFLRRGGTWQRWPSAAKKAAAARLVREVEQLVQDRAGNARSIQPPPRTSSSR